MFWRPQMNEADTCRKYIVPLLQAAGWDNDPHSITEQRYFSKGRVIVRGSRASRREGKKADYLLRYTRDFILAVVEAKAIYKKAKDGPQQAKSYAQTLGLKFAYASNGEGTVEQSFTTGTELPITNTPTGRTVRKCSEIV
jgi:type I restriction enzyme R subunit